MWTNMAITMAVFYTVAVSCLLFTIIQAHDVVTNENLLKRIETLETQGIIQQRRMDQQDKLLAIYEEKIKQQQVQLHENSDKMTQLENQLSNTLAQLADNENSTHPGIVDTKELHDDQKWEINEKGFVENRDMDEIDELAHSMPIAREQFDVRSAVNRKSQDKQPSRRLLMDDPGGPVAFHATADNGAKSNVGKDQHILYEDVHINLGNGFHSMHGLFIAPKAGLYLFSTSIMGVSGGPGCVATIMKNGAKLANTYGTPGAYDQGSVTLVTQLDVGDEVWVASTQLASASYYGDMFTSFMGYLLL